MLFARLALAIMFAWYGAMNFTAVGTELVGSWIAGHALLSGLGEQAASAARALGVYQIVAAVLMVIPLPGISFRRIGLGMAAVHAVGALTLVLTNPVWIAELGGFPAIGAGQGLIKHLAILGLALWAGSLDTHSRMFAARHAQTREWSQPVMWAGLVLVLGWIGAMKFTAVEAAGIDPLIRTSPLFAWTLSLTSVRYVSWGIGILELLTVAALMGYWFRPALLRIGLLMAMATFALTLSFLVTFPGSWADSLGGFPALARTGHFLLADLPLLATALALLSEIRNDGRRWRRR